MIEVGGKTFAIGLFWLTILFAVICCAVFSMKVDDVSTEQAYINERRAKTGLLWISIGAFILSAGAVMWFMPNATITDDKDAHKDETQLEP